MPHAGDGPDRTPWLAWGFAFTAVAIVLGPALGPLTAASAPAAVAALHGAAALLAVGLAASGVLFWQATGRARGVWLGATAAVLPLGVVAQFVLSNDLAGPVAGAVSTVGGAHLIAAILSPDVDTDTTPRRVLPRAAALALAAGTLAFAARALAGDAITVIAGVTWLTAAMAGSVLAWRGAPPLAGWIAAAAVPVGLGRFSDLATVGAVVPPSVAPLLQGAGLAIATIGVAVAMSRSVAQHRDRILDRELTHRALEESRRLATEDRNHDLGNALMAIEGATLAIARLRDRLTDQQQEELAEAVVRSAAEVRRLTGSELEELVLESADVCSVVERQATLARANGVAVEVEVAEADAAALQVAMPSAEVQQLLQNLVVNAQRHGGADAEHPVTITVARHDHEVVVEVLDEGPGVPHEESERVFERRARLSGTSDGEGLGLHVARRLVRARGGDLVVAPSARGARFVVRLPMASTLTSA